MPHILFLMSDTGGGHRAAAHAIEAALQEKHSGEFTVELVDLWKDYAPFPLNTMPRTYMRWVNLSPETYSAQFWVNDRLVRNSGINRIYNRSLFPRFRRMYAEHPADIIVSVHSVFTRPGIYALKKLGLTKPYITVITDYALPTVLWYDPAVDCCCVPTEPAYQRGLALGMQPSQMVLTGAPVHPKFSHFDMGQQQAREQLGWTTDRPIVLLVGGGDGMGPLVATAQAIDERQLNAELVIVAGRNAALKTALEANIWKRPTRIYGFVDNMQVFMKAADLLISKAGPATITEAAIVGTPLILSGAIQYQESPNVDYVVEKKAGVYAPGPRRVAQSVAEILAKGGETLEQLKRGIQKLAQPEAVFRIADEIWRYA